MRIAVTGGHGFVGSHVVDAALAAGANVAVIATPWGDLAHLRGVVDDPRVEIRRSDVTEADSLRGVFEGCHAVVHAAARVTDYGPWEAFERVNVEGTRNVAREAARVGIARLVLVSSIAVWRYVGIHGDDPRTRPRDRTRRGYGLSKRLAEDAALEIADEPVLVRPALWPYGTRDPNLRRVVAALRGRRLPLVDGGRARLQTVDVRFLARVLLAAATSPTAAGRSYYVADDGVVTWREALTQVAELAGAPAPRLSLPSRLVVPFAAATERLWSGLGLSGEPPLTRYRAELMRSDVVFSAADVPRDLGLRPDRDRRTALREAVRSCLPDVA